MNQKHMYQKRLVGALAAIAAVAACSMLGPSAVVGILYLLAFVMFIPLLLLGTAILVWSALRQRNLCLIKWTILGGLISAVSLLLLAPVVTEVYYENIVHN